MEHESEDKETRGKMKKTKDMQKGTWVQVKFNRLSCEDPLFFLFFFGEREEQLVATRRESAHFS